MKRHRRGFASRLVTGEHHAHVVRFRQDNGIGVSKADQVHLFERFFRESNAVYIQGTGLGLHIVAKYVELMSGSIDFTSEPGKGTSVVLKFPQPLPA